jgi:hypothetical protein
MKISLRNGTSRVLSIVASRSHIEEVFYLPPKKITTLPRGYIVNLVPVGVGIVQPSSNM